LAPVVSRAAPQYAQKLSVLRNSQENITGESVDSRGFFVCLASRFCIVAVMASAFER
jgi:hypothetical protein